MAGSWWTRTLINDNYQYYKRVKVNGSTETTDSWWEGYYRPTYEHIAFAFSI